MSTDLDARFNDDRYGRVESATTTPHVTYINEAGIPDSMMARVKGNREIASQIEKWSQSLSLSSEPSGSYDVFSRSRWRGERHTFALMSKCAWAVENDDVLSTLSDVVEALMFTKNHMELDDLDQQDMWNQWAMEVDLDSLLRKWARELFKVSQAYIGVWWDKRIYEVRDNPADQVLKDFKAEMLAKREAAMAEANGEDPTVNPPKAKGPGRGNRSRKKKFAVTVPTGFTVFDPTKIMPVGNLMFGRERFAYIANRGEADAFDMALAGTVRDDTVVHLIEGRYTPTQQDMKACGEVGVDSEHMFLFKEESLFRHTLTKADYERFAPIRLKPILPVLDMKSHLRNSDRASLIGNTNFIVVIKKGTDRLPAKAAEIENLREQAGRVARLPILVGDHRLSVEIVAPPLDNTLIESRWQVLDSRLVFRALNTFTPIVQGGASHGAGVSEMSRIVSRGLESRRHMMVRTLEKFVFAEVMKQNEGMLSETPSLAFTPRRITLDVSTDILQAMIKLRDRGDISRETTLEELDFDQTVELRRRAHERVNVDEIFDSQTPYGSPATNPYAPLGPDGQPVPPPAAPATPGAVPAKKAAAAPVKKTDTSPTGGRPPGVKETAPRTPKGDVKA